MVIPLPLATRAESLLLKTKAAREQLSSLLEDTLGPGRGPTSGAEVSASKIDGSAVSPERSGSSPEDEPEATMGGAGDRSSGSRRSGEGERDGSGVESGSAAAGDLSMVLGISGVEDKVQVRLVNLLPSKKQVHQCALIHPVEAGFVTVQQSELGRGQFTE